TPQPLNERSSGVFIDARSVIVAGELENPFSSNALTTILLRVLELRVMFAMGCVCSFSTSLFVIRIFACAPGPDDASLTTHGSWDSPRQLRSLLSCLYSDFVNPVLEVWHCRRLLLNGAFLRLVCYVGVHLKIWVCHRRWLGWTTRPERL